MALRKKVAPVTVPAPSTEVTPKPQSPVAPQPPSAAEAVVAGRARAMTPEETDAMARQTVIEAGQPDPATPPAQQDPPAPAPAPAPAPPPSASVVSEPPPAETQAVAVRGPGTALGKALDMESGGAVVGDFGVEDIKFPELKIVQGSGKLSGTFSVGTVILDMDVLSYPPQDLKDKNQFMSLRIIPVRIAKFYRETVSKEDQDNGVMSGLAFSEREVHANGGMIGYGVGKWRAAGSQHLLVEKPENLPEQYADSPLFDTELDGKLYAPAKYYANGGAYKDFTQTLLAATRSLLKEPVLNTEGKVTHDESGRIRKRIVLWKYFWTWQLARKQRGDFWVWSPEAVCKREPIGPEALAYCEEIHHAISGDDVSPSAE